MRSRALLFLFLTSAWTSAPGPASAVGGGAPIPGQSPLQTKMPPVRADLFSISELATKDPLITPQHVQSLNAELVRALSEEPALENSRRRTSISGREAEKIRRKKINHPVVGVEATRAIYDPTGRFGFCFGRAQWAVIELLQRGVARESIKKIFAVGPMWADGITWQFHVATMVRGPKGSWLVIDTEAPRVVTAQEWMADLNKTSLDGKLLFHVTEPERLGASTTEKFSARHYRALGLDPQYRQYFENMMSSFREESRQKLAGLRSCKKVFR